MITRPRGGQPKVVTQRGIVSATQFCFPPPNAEFSVGLPYGPRIRLDWYLPSLALVLFARMRPWCVPVMLLCSWQKRHRL
jgi:hypothetical protein